MAQTLTNAIPARAPRPRRRFRWKGASLWLGAAIIGVYFLAALAAPLLAPPDPSAEFSPYRDIGEINRWVPFQPGPGLIFGSVPDPANARQLDIWYSLVWGTRSALRFGIVVALLAAAFGILLGGTSAYIGGLTNTLLMGFTDAFLAFPLIAGVVFFKQFLLTLLYGTGIRIFVGEILDVPEAPTRYQQFLMGLDPLLIAFIVFSWMPYARLMNSVVQGARRADYLMAARSLGAGHLRLIFRHLLPNSIAPAIVLAARDVGYLVLLQAGFTFIGLSGRSEWGEMLSLGRNYVIGPGGNLFTYWWIFFPPTLAIVLFGVGWNLLGDSLNDRLDPYQT